MRSADALEVNVEEDKWELEYIRSIMKGVPCGLCESIVDLEKYLGGDKKCALENNWKLSAFGGIMKELFDYLN